VRSVDYISGDTWNVNPIAVKRVERLFCRNERVVIPLELPSERGSLTLVAVAAILVASVQLHFLGSLNGPLDLKYRGPNRIACRAAFEKGEELGFFQHGSRMRLFTTREFDCCDPVAEGATIRMGQPLLRRIRRAGDASSPLVKEALVTSASGGIR